MAIYNNVSVANTPFSRNAQPQVKTNDKSVSEADQVADSIKSASSVFSAELVNQREQISQPSIPSSEQNQQQDSQQANDYSLILSQHESDNDSLSYDQPSAKERGAIAAYQQVATHSQREQVLDSMSFHFVV